MRRCGVWDTTPRPRSPGTDSGRWRERSLHEELHIKPEVIEHQLAHAVPDALGGAYNRTKFIDARRAMMNQWADYLGKLKAGAEVIAITTAA
jgi:hypothetical protein